METPHTSYLPESVKHIADTRLTNRRQYLVDMPKLLENAPLDAGEDGAPDPDLPKTNLRQYLRDMPELPEDAPIDPSIEAKTRPGVEWRNLPDKKRGKGV